MVILSAAAQQFKQDFPLSLYFSVPFYKENGHYVKSNDNDDIEVSWYREGIYDYRTEYYPFEYGNNIYVQMYDRTGKLIDRNINGDPLPLIE